ncbi:MAG: TRAP transporter small permease [Pseudomonadota bacterium]
MTITPSKTIARLTRAEAVVVDAIGWLLILMLAGVIAVVSLQIASRYLLDVSLIWSEEVARLLFITLIFLGGALLARGREHLAVTAFVDLLPARARHLADGFVAGVGLVCASYLVRGAWATLMREWDQLTPGLQFPMGVVFTIVFVACVLMAMWLALSLMKSARAAVLNLPHHRTGSGRAS